MSFNFENIGREICLIKSKNKKKDKIISMSDGNDARNSYSEISVDPSNEYLQYIKDSDTERICLYVIGMSGSGKSYWSAAFVNQWKLINKKKEIFLISPITDDKSINSLSPTRLNPLSDTFQASPPSVNDFPEGSMLICDDIEAYSKKIQKTIMELVNSILTTGRHYKISIIFIAHSACNGAATKLLLNESTAVTVFPKNMTGKSANYLLGQYFGLDNKEIKAIKKLPSRAITIVRSYPMVLLTNNQAIMLNDFE